jgi:hypothetical protein
MSRKLCNKMNKLNIAYAVVRHLTSQYGNDVLMELGNELKSGVHVPAVVAELSCELSSSSMESTVRILKEEIVHIKSLAELAVRGSEIAIDRMYAKEGIAFPTVTEVFDIAGYDVEPCTAFSYECDTEGDDLTANQGYSYTSVGKTGVRSFGARIAPTPDTEDSEEVEEVTVNPTKEFTECDKLAWTSESATAPFANKCVGLGPFCMCGAAMRWETNDVDSCSDSGSSAAISVGGDSESYWCCCDVQGCVEKMIPDGTRHLCCPLVDCSLRQVVCLACAAKHFSGQGLLAAKAPAQKKGSG